MLGGWIRTVLFVLVLVRLGVSSLVLKPSQVEESYVEDGRTGDGLGSSLTGGGGVWRRKRAQQQISPQKPQNLTNVEMVVGGMESTSSPPTPPVISSTSEPFPLPDLLTPPTGFHQGTTENDAYNLGGNTGEPYDVENCPECQHLLNENHDLVHAQHRASTSDHFLNNCSRNEDCVNLDFLRCNRTEKEEAGLCVCLPDMTRALIRSGRFKGTLWCLVMDRFPCTTRDTKNEDCVSGKCEKNGICARSVNGTAPRTSGIPTPLLLFPLLRLQLG